MNTFHGSVYILSLQILNVNTQNNLPSFIFLLHKLRFFMVVFIFYSSYFKFGSKLKLYQLKFLRRIHTHKLMSKENKIARVL